MINSLLLLAFAAASNTVAIGEVAALAGSSELRISQLAVGSQSKANQLKSEKQRRYRKIILDIATVIFESDFKVNSSNRKQLTSLIKRYKVADWELACEVVEDLQKLRENLDSEGLHYNYVATIYAASEMLLTLSIVSLGKSDALPIGYSFLDDDLRLMRSGCWQYKGKRWELVDCKINYVMDPVHQPSRMLAFRARKALNPRLFG